jgi:hypothetical protein
MLRSFDHPVFSSWFQGLNIPSLMQIDLSILEVEVNIHTYPQFKFYIRWMSTIDHLAFMLVGNVTFYTMKTCKVITAFEPFFLNLSVYM